jgi:hypothetical protein
MHVPPPPPSEGVTPPKSHTPVGPIVGIVIIIGLLLLGALYFLGEQLRNNASNPPAFIPGDDVQSP